MNPDPVWKSPAPRRDVQVALGGCGPCGSSAQHSDTGRFVGSVPCCAIASQPACKPAIVQSTESFAYESIFPTHSAVISRARERASRSSGLKVRYRPTGHLLSRNARPDSAVHPALEDLGCRIARRGLLTNERALSPSRRRGRARPVGSYKECEGLYAGFNRTSSPASPDTLVVARRRCRAFTTIKPA